MYFQNSKYKIVGNCSLFFEFLILVKQCVETFVFYKMWATAHYFLNFYFSQATCVETFVFYEMGNCSLFFEFVF